jgi:hypothetical protein
MDDQASPSIDWSQFKPVAPEAPSSAVDWSQFKPATNGGNAAMAGDAGVPDFGTPDTPYTPGSQPDIGEGLSKVAGVGTSFLRGTAAGMAQLPLKATKYTDLALATGPMLADAVRSGVTGKQHSEATDWWMRNMVAPADASLQSLQDFTNESGNAAAAHGGQAVGNMGTNLAAMVLTGGESAAPELAAAGGGAIRQGADILGKALATSAKASAVPATTEGLETGEKVYDETGDASAAIKAGAADAALTVGQNMLPISVEGGKALRAGVGAASSAVAGEARRQAQNTVMPGTLQTPFDWGDVGMNALFGAGMGVAFHGPHVDDPNVVAQKYNDLQRAADDGNAVAQKATTIVGDLSSVDGLSSHAITSAQLGASAGADVHDVPHEQLMQTSDRYRQIYNAATPDLSPEQAQSYAKEAYASEVSNNVAWDAYLSQKNLLQQNAGQARIASDIRTMLDTASKQVDPVEMNKLQRWAMAAPRAPLEVRNALYETLTNRAVPDHIEAQHGEDFHPDGALTDKALAKDASPDHVDVSYPDTPEVATALKTTNVVPYRVGKTLVVHGQPDDVQPIVEYLHATTGQLPHAGVHHAEETAVHAEDQDGQSQRDEGDQGGHAAGERAVAEGGQPAEADRLHEGSPEQVDNTVTPRNKAVLDSLTKAGLEAKVNARGRIEIHPGSQHADQLMEAAAHDTNEEVTPAQAASGNYRKGKSILRSPHGDVPIHIETPDGVTRRGEGWSRPVRGAHYGYIPGTKGADGDPLDVFAMRGAHDDSRPVAVISQHDPKTGAFDELKVVMGARTKAEALQTYKRQYPGDLHAGLLPKGKANVVMMDRAKFKRFLDANAADVPPHPVSGMPMLHLRRDRLARNEDVDHVPQNQGAVGRHGQAVEGEDAQSAGGQLHARPAVPSEGPRKESPQARGIRKVASDAPVYQHGQGAKPVSVVGVHYSTTPGLTALDPRKAGTGSAGRERMRIGSSIGRGDPLASLVHFYVREGKGLPEKERVVTGQHPYEAKLNNLYDVRHDPEGIIDSAYQHGYGMNKDAIMEAIHDAGYDGVLMKSQPGMPEGHIAAVFGDGKVPVKSVAEEPRMALVKGDKPTLFSALTRAVESGKGAPRRADAATWKQWLDGAQRRGEVKQAERDWVGVDRWLDEQNGPITRDDLTAFVKANEVKVKLQDLRDITNQDIANEMYGRLDRLAGKVTDEQKQALQDWVDGKIDHNKLVDIVGQYPADALEVLQRDETEPKYRKYTTPGGSNYREHLLTLPVTRGEQTFVSSHWDGFHNVVTHVRMDDRVEDGQKILHIHEIQSDWHQEGKKSGYFNIKERDALRDRIAELSQRLNHLQDEMTVAHLHTNDDAKINDLGKKYNELHAERAALVEKHRVIDDLRSVPEAPFKATKEWSMLGIKHAALEAVHNGQDAIEWDTGTVNADRYSLRKVVDNIRYSKNDDGTFRVVVRDKKYYTTVWHTKNASIEEVERTLGKDIAEKIQRGEGDNSAGPSHVYELKGNDLEMGGEGMKAFYDHMLVNEVNQWAKKFGGKVVDADTHMGTYNPLTKKHYINDGMYADTVQVHRLEITPAMRKAVASGLPMFAIKHDGQGTIESRLEKITGVKAGSNGEIVDRAAYDKAVDAYSKIPDTMGGKILSTDVARELSPDYLKDRTLSADTHEAASSFIKALYREKLAEPPGKNAVVVFTAGGTGAGKTSALIDSYGIQFADLVYDTNLNGSSSLKKIMQALDSGRNVQVMYVYRDPVDAMRHGALIRAEGQAKKFGSGRTVPVSAHVETHVEVLGSVRGLIKHFAGDDRFSVKTFDNSFGKGNAREVDIDSVKDLQYDVVNKDVIHTIEEAYQHGEISAQTYKGFLGRHPQERLQGGERAQGGSDQREAGPDRSGPEGPERENVHGLAEPQRDERRPDQVSQFSWEAVPSMSIPDHAWIHDATPEFKMAYTKAVNDVIGSKILDEFGIDHAGVTVGFGGWEGVVNPSVQEHFSKAQQNQLANAAATYGLLLKQDGVAYHTPEYSGKPSEENGVHVQIGRPLNAAETAAIYDRLTVLAQDRFGLSEGDAQGFAPIPNAEGVRFLNFNEDIPNKAFSKLVFDAVTESLPDNMTFDTHTFKSVGDLITNDWSKDPHGKGYVQRLIEAGGWDSARRTLDRLRPEVARIDQDFRARAEAGDGGQAAADQIHSARAAEAVRHSDAHFKEISSHVQKVAGTLKHGDRMVVYRRLDDVPKNDPLRAWVDHMVGNVNAADIGGVYHNGRVYLFAENLKDRADAERVVMHETVGHGGIRAVFGDDLGKFLDSIHDTVKNTSLYREIESAYARAYPKASAAELRRVLADEYMAALAESPDERGVWAKFVGWVRQWARAHGMVSKWTENDLRQLLGKVAGDMRYGRVSIGGREAPQTLLDIEIPTSTYDGAAGRGQILYHADSHRTLQLDNHVAADLYSRVSGDRQMLEAHNIVYSTPADLLHLTRFAGEEGKDGIVLSKSGEDRVPRGTLEASGIPFRELPGHYELLASKTGEQPAYSLRNRAKGTDEQEAILKRAIAHSEYNMTPWDRMQHTMREFRDVVQSGDGVLELKQGYVDALAPIARYERHLNGGLLLDAAQSAYKMSWMAKNNEQITAGVMKLGVPRYNAGSFEVVPGRKGLMDIFKPLYHGVDGKPLDALWEGYAMARRSAELIKQTNPDGTSREKLLSQDDIDKLLDLEQKYPFFKTVLDDYQQFNNELLDLAVERGALSRETADLWKQNTYVPFYRALEEGNNETNSWRQGKGISGKKVTSQRLYGSDKMAEPIIESIIKNSGAILDKVYANEAMRRVVQVANGIGLERVKMPFSPVALSLGDIEKTLAKINYFAGTSKPSGGYTHHIPPAEMDRLVTFFKMSKPVGPDIVSVMEAGKPVYYKVTDASLYRAITAFNDIGSFDKVLGAILGVPKKVLTLGVTLDPRFMYRNFLRDAITTWAQTGTNPNMLKDMVKNAREVYSDGQFINQLRVAGYNGNEYFKVNEMRETLAEMHGAGWTVLNTPKKLYHAYHRIGFISEQTNRMRVAKHILDNGGSMAEAAWQAQNTLNFQMRGDNRAMQLLIRAVPFLNARIQGLNRLYDGATGRDVTVDRKRAVMSFLLKSAGIMAASMALTLKNKDDPRFTRIPEASKDLYYHFFVGDHHFVLPKPFELGSLLGTLPERTFRLMTGRDTGKTFVQAMERMVTNTFQISVIPQAIQPGIEDWANKDSLTDNPIVSQSEQDLLPEAQYTPHTSPTIIDVAHAMPKLAPDALRSPARLEHLYRGYTATLGGYLLMMADGLQRATGSAPVAPASRYGHVALGALEGTFGLGNPATDPRNKYVQQVYDAQDEADRAAKTLSQYVKQGHVEDVRDLVKEERTALSYRATIRSVAAELGTMRKAEMAIYQSPTMSADDKRARLDKINAARQKMLDRIGPMLDMVTDYH